MANQERRHYLALAKHNTVDETVLNWLVDRDLIPRDVELKAYLEGLRRGGEDDTNDDYREAFNEAVVAALEGNEAPDFLSAPYPDVMTFFEAADWSGPPPISMISEDFHKFGTLYHLAKKLEVNPNVMYTLWFRLITEIDPSIGLKIAEQEHKTSRWYFEVGNTYIKDEPALEVYQDTDVRSRLRIGISERAVRPLGYMLADNHPELLAELAEDADL